MKMKGASAKMDSYKSRAGKEMKAPCCEKAGFQAPGVRKVSLNGEMSDMGRIQHYKQGNRGYSKEAY